MSTTPTDYDEPIAALPYECPHCDVFPFATAEQLAAHACDDVLRRERNVAAARSTARAAVAPTPEATPTGSGRFETVPNGFGGSTTRRTEAPAARTAGNGPTERQTNWVRSLLADRAGVPEAEAIRALLNQARTDGRLTRRVVSTAIDSLLAIPRPKASPSQQAARPQGGVTIDREALPTPARGVLRVAVTNDSGHSTYLAIKLRADAIVVCQEIGGQGDVYLGRQENGGAYRGKFAHLVARALEDPHAAMIRYGQEVKTCGHCGIKLTNKTSRDAGIGPVCRTKG